MHALRITRLTLVTFLAAASFALLGAFAPVAHAIGPADGDGVLSVTPDTVVEGEDGLSFLFDFYQNKNRLVSFALLGSQLRISVPAEWPAPQFDSPEAPGYVTVEEGSGGGLFGLNSCNYDLVGPFVDGMDIVIFQHCLRNDHLSIYYQNVTAPAFGVYEFPGWTRAGFSGGDYLDSDAPTVTVSPVCEDGYHAEGIECVPNLPPSCGDGFMLVDIEGTMMCVPEGPAPESCPEGMMLSEGMCVPEGEVPAPCPEGMELVDDMCVDPTPTSPCAEGYTYSAEEDQCINNENPEEEIPTSCPEGEVVVDGACVTPEHTPSCGEHFNYDAELDMCIPNEEDPSCPAHYTLNNETLACEFDGPFPPSCEDGFHLSDDNAACLVNEPPICEDGFHVEGDQCVANPSPGGGSTYHPGERSSSGSVLGAETGPEEEAGSCTPLLSGYLYEGKENDAEQVKLLQAFLNTELSLTLEASGVYDAATAEAVDQFQLKYWEEVLAPWVPFGLPTDHTPTGNVYKLTLWKINSLHCGETLPAPELP